MAGGGLGFLVPLGGSAHLWEGGLLFLPLSFGGLRILGRLGPLR